FFNSFIVAPLFLCWILCRLRRQAVQILWGLPAPTPRGWGVSPPRARGVSGAARPRTPQFGFCGGCPPPRPGDGEFRPPGRVTFSTPKKSPKRRRGHPGPRFFCLIGLNLTWGFSSTELGFDI